MITDYQFDIQIKRGLKANLPLLKDGEFALCTDVNSKELYIGTVDGNLMLLPVNGTGGSIQVEDSLVNGNIVVNGVEIKIYDDVSIQNSISGKANSIHPHIISDTTGLQSALDNKSDKNHPHTVSEITSLQTTLDSKAEKDHSHTLSDIIDLDISNKTNGYVPQYDSTVGKYVSKALPTGIGEGATSLDGLTDVDISTIPPQEGDVLTYQGGIFKPKVGSGLIMEELNSLENVEKIGTIPPKEVSNLISPLKTDETVKLSWTASKSLDVIGYEVYKDSILLTTLTETSYIATELTGSTTYSFGIKAKDLSNSLSPVVSISVTTSAQEKYISMTGAAGSALQLPSMTVDTVEIEMVINSTQPNPNWYIFDAKPALVNGYISNDSKNSTIEHCWIDGRYIAGLTLIFPKNKRTVLKIQNMNSFTDNLTVFANGTVGSMSTKGRIYRVTCWNAGIIVANYLTSSGSVEDQSGNGRHAILTGGTFI